MGHPITSTKVYEVLRSLEGEEVPLAVLIEQTGLNRDQIIGALNTMRRVRGLPIEPVIRGYSYRLRAESGNAPAKVAKRMFEEVGILKSGAILIQDDNGALYKAEEM